MTDPVTVEITKEVVGAGADAVKAVFRTLLGPAATELGETLGDSVRFFRRKNQVRLLLKFKKMLDAAGLEAQAVPQRVLFPLLEHATLEDDEALSDRWAALLANASCGAAWKAPIYVEVLRQISPPEARLLEHMATPKGASEVTLVWVHSALADEDYRLPLSAEQVELLGELDFDDEDEVAIALEHLVGLGVVDRTARQSSLGPFGGTNFTLSTFGTRFLVVCRPPISNPSAVASTVKANNQ